MTDTATAVPPVPVDSAEAAKPAEADRGSTTVAESVVATIASLTARDIEGVTGLGGALSGAVGQVVERVRGKEHVTAGVDAEVGQTETAIDLSVRLHYPVAIHEIAEQIRRSVIDRVQSLTGLKVVEVNITVTDLDFPDSGEDDEQRVAQSSRVR